MSRTAPKSSPPAKEPRLTEQAVAGSILEASGATAEEMARKLGCATATVHRWRKNPEYRDLVNGHRAQTEAAIRDDLLDVRRTVLDGIAVAASCIVQMLREERAAAAMHVDEEGNVIQPRPLDVEVIVKGTKALVDLWRPIAAQTGITETTRHEVGIQVITPEQEAEAAQAVVARMLG